MDIEHPSSSNAFNKEEEEEEGGISHNETLWAHPGLPKPR